MSFISVVAVSLVFEGCADLAILCDGRGHADDSDPQEDDSETQDDMLHRAFSALFVKCRPNAT